jgi:predicted nucleic acid-binding protein
VSVFVDTSVFIRYLADDDPPKTERCTDLLERAERGEIALVTSEGVVAEVVYVLASPRLYNVPRAVLAPKIIRVLLGRGMALDRKPEVLAALARFGSTALDFVDCLAIEHALATTAGQVASYNRDYDRVEGIRRIEP